MNNKQLRRFAIDYCANKIYTSDMCDQNDYESVFLPLISSEVRAKMVQEKVIVLYEYYDKALPRSINGKPVFEGFHYLKKEDVEKINRYIDEIENALKSKGFK